MDMEVMSPSEMETISLKCDSPTDNSRLKTCKSAKLDPDHDDHTCDGSKSPSLSIAPGSDDSLPLDPPESDHSSTTNAAESDHSSTTNAAESDYTSTTNTPEFGYSSTTNAPELDYSSNMNVPESDYSLTTNAPEFDYSSTMNVPDFDYSSTMNVPDFDYSSTMNVPESDYSSTTNAPESDNSSTMNVPESENLLPMDAPESVNSPSVDAPESDDSIPADSLESKDLLPVDAPDISAQAYKVEPFSFYVDPEEGTSRPTGSHQESSSSSAYAPESCDYSSDSDNNIDDKNLPLKKRKRECKSDVSSSEAEDNIDYANLTPQQIKELIEQARRIGAMKKKKCKCPKTRWKDLPIKGPTQPRNRCLVGKGDWSEKLEEECDACAAGSCLKKHKSASSRRGRRRYQPPRLTIVNTPNASRRSRGTIGDAVPVIEISDEEPDAPEVVASEITVSTTPVKGECIVLSSDDDDEIVCEGVVNSNERRVPPSNADGGVPTSSGVFDVTPLDAPAPAGPPVLIMAPQYPEPWPDASIDLNWDATLDLLATLCDPPAALPHEPELVAAAALTAPAVAPAVAPAPAIAPAVAPAGGAGPPSPSEGWSCPICLEPKSSVSEIMSTVCGHVFCGECIRSAVKIHHKCPTCRKKLTVKQFHKIFL